MTEDNPSFIDYLLCHDIRFYGRDIPPFVSSDSLNRNIDNPRLMIIDIRSGEEFKKGYISNALKISVNSWAIDKNGLLRELPGYIM